MWERSRRSCTFVPRIQQACKASGGRPSAKPLAVHRRLKSQPPASADSFDDDSLEPSQDEVDAIEGRRYYLDLPGHRVGVRRVVRGEEGASTTSYACEEQESRAINSRPVGGRSALRRRKSVRFSDADEAHVSKGFAFDRVVRKDGTVSGGGSRRRGQEQKPRGAPSCG